MSKKIFLSPSNQTDNTYAYGNTNEAVQCGRIADATKVALERCGFEVKINHLGTLAEKVAQSNAWGADLHIPIHSNACNGSVSGTRIFYYSAGSNSYKACKAIYDVLAPITPGTSENISAYPGLYEMNQTKATSVYIEVDFHDVSSVAKWIIEHPVEIGEAICKGVCNYYGVTYKTSTTPAQNPSTPVATKTLYRIRKSWADAASQKGAYSVLANAKAACDSGYWVFDSDGKLVYPTNITLVSGAKYTNGTSIPAWVIKSKLYAREIRSNGDVVFSTLQTGAVTGVVSPAYISKRS